MGVRPSFFTVFGLESYTDKIPRDFGEEQIIFPTDQEPTHGELYVMDVLHDRANNDWQWASDLVYTGNPMSSSAKTTNILGWKNSTIGYDSDTFRALAMIYPEFMTSGYRVLPLEEPEEQHARWSQLPACPCEGIIFQPHWWYQQGYYISTPMWAYVTRYLLNWAGIEVDYRKFKWMLVWDWS